MQQTHAVFGELANYGSEPFKYTVWLHVYTIHTGLTGQNLLCWQPLDHQQMHCMLQ